MSQDGFHLNGGGVEKDYDKAENWHRKAGEDGYFYRGLMILDGKAKKQEHGYSGMDWIDTACLNILVRHML